MNLPPKYNFKTTTTAELNSIRHYSYKKALKFLNIPIYKLPVLGIKIRQQFKKRIPYISIIKNIDKALKKLNQSEMKLYIVSSNSKDNIKTILEKNPLDFFQEIYSGASLFGKARLIKKLIKSLDARKEEVIYIVDKVRDIQAAKK